MTKKKVKNREPSKRWEHYNVEGEKIERKRGCPRCGEGVFLAEHNDRFYCGQCHYVEIKSKKVEKTKESK